jgi:hypothetical protein
MITQEFKTKVRNAILQNRENYPSLSDAKYAKILGISASVFSRLKNGETEKIVTDHFWIEQGRKLNVTLKDKKWTTVRTKVYVEIENSIHFCKKYKKAIILIDDCGIGKSFCTRHITQHIENAFYIDCSQGRTKTEFIRLLARTLGVDTTGKIADVKANLKYYINLIQPFIALDDAGYLNNNVIPEIIETWNASEGNCGWMMIGDHTLQEKFRKGLQNKKIGFPAVFDRFSGDYTYCIPTGSSKKKQDYLIQLIGDVASANMADPTKVNQMIKKCLTDQQLLRHLDTLIQKENEKSINC